MKRYFAFADCADAGILEEKLLNYYTQTEGYCPFNHAARQTDRWVPIVEFTREVLRKREICRVLEVGAGRSCLDEAFESFRECVYWTAQDVTDCNLDHLSARADAVHIGDFGDLPGPFDLIASFFVFEHLANPESALRTWLSQLAPGGRLFIFCPRYDFPGYLSHSADHYSIWRRMMLAVFVQYTRIRVWIKDRPCFLIHLDPAIFRKPFARDRDAVHWVLRSNVLRAVRPEGRVQLIKLPAHGIKDWFIKRFCELSVVIEKNSDGSNARVDNSHARCRE